MLYTLGPYNPWMISNPTLPKLYWAVKSPEQLVANLYCIIDYTEGYINDLSEIVEGIASDMDDVKAYVDQEITRMRADIEEIKRIIEGIESGTQVWNVSKGAWDAPIAGMRDNVRFVAVHATTCGDIAASSLTVKGLSESSINAWGLAVYGLWLYDMDSTLPDKFNAQLQRS